MQVEQQYVCRFIMTVRLLVLRHQLSGSVKMALTQKLTYVPCCPVTDPDIGRSSACRHG
jgi:hypothetical protein